jgi:hypothetical protein
MQAYMSPLTVNDDVHTVAIMNAVDDRICRSQGGRLCPLLLEQNIVCLNSVQKVAAERLCIVALLVNLQLAPSKLVLQTLMHSRRDLLSAATQAHFRSNQSNDMIL